MHIYSTGQWTLLFFFYCFCGWVWESCYVSICQRRWVNRGFLSGPLLPIYGTGAILILFVTLPAEDHLFLVWLLGMLAATVLEYVTGAAMEKLFKVRYWDYSKHKFNLNGHICLSSSIAWGFFSIFLVRFLHPPIGQLLSRIPSVFVDPLALALTIAFTVDAVRSVQAALDLREVLTKLTEENEDLRRLAKRAEVAAAFAEEDLRRFRERTQLGRQALQTHIEAELQERREARDARKLRWQAQLEDSLRHRTARKLDALSAIGETLEACRDHLSEIPGLTAEVLEERRRDLNEALERVRAREFSIRQRTAKTYQKALRILWRNPSALARECSEAMDSLRKLMEQK